MGAEFGWIVPEEEIALVLNNGLAGIVEAIGDSTLPDLVQRIYFNLPDATRTTLVGWWSAHLPKIIHGYPHFEVELPCYAVVIDPEEQVQQFGGDADHEAVLTTGEHVIVFGERWRPTIGVIAYAENADVARWMYQFAKFTIARGRRELADVFPHAQRLSGRDLKPEAFPNGGRFRFARVLQVQVEHDQLDAALDDIGSTDSALSDTEVTDGFPR